MLQTKGVQQCREKDAPVEVTTYKDVERRLVCKGAWMRKTLGCEKPVGGHENLRSFGSSCRKHIGTSDFEVA
jgi:hypothetical protein